MFAHILEASPHEPRIKESQKYDIIRTLHRMLEKWSEFAPRRIGHNPVPMTCGGQKVNPFINLAPITARHSLGERSLAATGLKNPARWLEMLHYLLG